MKKIIVLIVIFFFCMMLYSQEYQLIWQRCYGGSNSDLARDIAVIENGYFITGGTSSNDGDIYYYHGAGDGWLIRIDSIGNVLWEKTFGGSDLEYFTRIIPTTDNNYYLLGLSFSSDGDISNDPYPGSPDYWIVKIDSSGNIIWDKIVGGNEGEVLSTGVATLDGGVVAIGHTYSNDGDVSVSYGGADTWAVKISSDGELEWDYTIGTDWIDKGQAILATSDGGYLIGSNSSIHEDAIGNITCTPHSYGFFECVLFKLDSNLNVEWQKCYGGTDNDGVLGLLEVADGYVFTGSVDSNDGDISGNHGDGDIWVVKIDFLGNIIWQKCLGGSRSEYANILNQTSNDEFIVTGSTRSNNGDVTGNHSMSEYDYDIWFVKLNNEGELLSQQCFGGSGSEKVEFGVVKKSDNNFVIAGYTDYGPSYDVACAPHGDLGTDKDWWVFEIKDCSQYPVGNLQTPTGPDTTCTVYDSTNAYAIGPATGAWYYEWRLIPEDAGTINGNGLTATVNWASGWEGTTEIAARAMNDCDTSEWSASKYTQVFTCLGINELQAGRSKLRVYPNPARGFVVFELPTAPNNNTVIPNPGAVQGAGVRPACRSKGQLVAGRNPPTNMGPASKDKRTSGGQNSKGIPPYGRNDKGSDMTVLVINVFGQQVAKLPLATGKTVWHTGGIEVGIYFYKLEIEGEVLSGKVIVQ